ncbi:conserved hypothetical protein [Aggregatibacter segnis ATCC 33393]|uniref:Uncharacterized protein n=1 Tax=Aggregatibacter segnis ATCC 33393 TaxID=888057 RepID=E6KXU6_9PAST|nr:conserved hypothetical protein [Aggregatibacter segnis ATCC 33393]
MEIRDLIDFTYSYLKKKNPFFYKADFFMLIKNKISCLFLEKVWRFMLE